MRIHITDALNALNIMEEKYNQMLAKEIQLKSNLAIFNESYSRPSGFNVKKVKMIRKLY